MNYLKMGEAALKRFDGVWQKAGEKSRGRLVMMMADALTKYSKQTHHTIYIYAGSRPTQSMHAPPPHDWPDGMSPTEAFDNPTLGTSNQIPVVATRIEQVEVVGDLEPAEREIVQPAPANEVPYEPVQTGGVREADIQALEGRVFTTEKPDENYKEAAGLPDAPLWPEETELLIYGWANNPRLMLAELPDKRKVSVWRAPRQYRLPQKFKCKLDVKNPGNPIYMIL